MGEKEFWLRKTQTADVYDAFDASVFRLNGNHGYTSVVEKAAWEANRLENEKLRKELKDLTKLMDDLLSQLSVGKRL